MLCVKNANAKNVQQIIIINENLISLRSMSKDKQKALFSFWSLKENNFQTCKTKIKKMLLQPSFAMDLVSSRQRFFRLYLRVLMLFKLVLPDACYSQDMFLTFIESCQNNSLCFFKKFSSFVSFSNNTFLGFQKAPSQ